MVDHRTGTRDEWLAERRELLEAEKEHTRRGDELAARRRELPWVRVEQEYAFTTGAGTANLADLFGGRSQLLVYHFMFPGCPSCASLVDGVDASTVHLENHDVAVVAVCRSPIDELTAFRERMGWRIPFASSADSSFNHDFGVSVTDEQLRDGAEYNFAPLPSVPADELGHWPRDFPGISAFAREGDEVFHTYSAYARGGDGLWSMYQWLDRTPLGRRDDPGGPWFRLRDEY
ncbi:DUF899 domain-containing protein [Pseudonocardia broussonetiae]|uniref:DUF899 domain-containing protein n=1 Tax=Pseudonocardia broussonetiae TaxID=2736640 RepID=A0A6M6JLX4_9PSEU|nr:DUF899 domain-containing protein [Pseudonocardia broussonetiae]QJY47642.1 DUF899 domain-containing protein [Pseudonocardia broussonetiae]